MLDLVETDEQLSSDTECTSTHRTQWELSMGFAQRLNSPHNNPVNRLKVCQFEVFPKTFCGFENLRSVTIWKLRRFLKKVFNDFQTYLNRSSKLVRSFESRIYIKTICDHDEQYAGHPFPQFQQWYVSNRDHIQIKNSSKTNAGGSW